MDDRSIKIGKVFTARVRYYGSDEKSSSLSTLSKYVSALVAPGSWPEWLINGRLPSPGRWGWEDEGGREGGRERERKSFIRHRTLVVGRNARVVWLSFRFLVEERPVRELYQAKVSRNTFPKLIAVVFNWNNGPRRVPRLLVSYTGCICALAAERRRDSEWDVRKREISTWRKSSEVVSYRL